MRKRRDKKNDENLKELTVKVKSKWKNEKYKRMRPAFGNQICKPDQVDTYEKKKDETRFW